ncbi:MAG: dksA [Rickettsiaceae bacterium]|jgi:DnaK suppressor protein|nr:dksA [Rickettsiaceae bacterium]
MVNTNQLNKVIVPEGYKPADKEEYMNPVMLEYYKGKLNELKRQILDESNETLEHLKEENLHEPDINDRATMEASIAFELRTRDRYRKLLDKIEAAIERINTGEYGYCEETGEEIGVKRLEARPFATLCIEAQERHEKYERLHNDDL